ncbi:MAG: DUF1491 family protein [Parvularcula sp.]
MTGRLKTRIFIDGLRTLVQARGGFSTILRQGHPDAGIVALIIRTSMTCSDIFIEARDGQGRLEWREVKTSVADVAVTDWLEREADFDPDLWALEVEQIAPAWILSQLREEG